MSGDSGVDSIIIDHPERMERLKEREIDDKIQTEAMLTRALAIILCMGILVSSVALGVFIAKGNSIPPVKGVSYANQGK